MARDRTHRDTRRQVGALCWRRDAVSGLQILLITSRDTGRWVTPKGNPMTGLTDPLSAAEEAFEEAGVRGPVGKISLGSFHYDKRLSGKARRSTEVALYPLEVQTEFDDWDEAHERTRRWFTAAEAAQAVDEPELKALIAAFRP
jgi:8-oxo-dGTP pyrophosphatase MutT (NUDIX family)